jgi:hypothetical protein
MNTQTAILPTAYLPSIQYFQKLLNYSTCVIEQHEHFIKQTYRNRCNIYTPNGFNTLSIPLVKRNQRQSIKEVKISYDVDWQKLHWRTLESSYRRSPFFEYYEDDFKPLYGGKKTAYLIDFNEALLQIIFPLLKIKPNYSFTNSYVQTYTDADDYRNIISPKENLSSDKMFVPKPYSQVFETKYGFIENLSIVDLLFNQGSRALEFI